MPTQGKAKNGPSYEPQALQTDTCSFEKYVQTRPLLFDKALPAIDGESYEKHCPGKCEMSGATARAVFTKGRDLMARTTIAWLNITLPLTDVWRDRASSLHTGEKDGISWRGQR